MIWKLFTRIQYDPNFIITCLAINYTNKVEDNENDVFRDAGERSVDEIPDYFDEKDTTTDYTKYQSLSGMDVNYTSFHLSY